MSKFKVLRYKVKLQQSSGTNQNGNRLVKTLSYCQNSEENCQGKEKLASLMLIRVKYRKLNQFI